MNRRTVFLVSISAFITLLMLTAVALAGFGDMTSTNYAVHGGFVGAVGGQITSTNTIAQETRLEPFGNLGWADGLPGQWLPPESLPITGTHPVLAFDDLGVLHATWLEDGGIGYATLPEGGSWTTPTLVSDTANALSVDLSVSPEGDAHLTWIEGDAVYYSFKLARGAWQNPATVMPTGGANAAASRVVLDAGGTAHLVWYDTGAGEFRYNHKPRGGEWRDNILHDGNPVPTDDIPDPGYTTASAEFDLIIDAAGVLHLVWCDGDQCYHGQKDSYYWNDTPVQLGVGVNLAAPAVALDEASNLYTVWASQRITDTGGGITYCAFDGATCAITQTWRAGYTTDAPAIAIDAAGQAHVVWHEGAPNGEIYYPQPAGVSQWLAPARLQFNLIGSHNPALLTGPSGVLHLMWQNTSKQHQGLYYMHTDPAPWQVTPDEVLAGTSTSITITGRGFTTPTMVSVYSQTLTGTVVNSTSLAFNLPDTLPGGWHDLTLTRGDGASNIIPDGVWVTESSTPLILEENVPTPYKAAFGVTVDPEGNTWFIEADSGNTPEGGSSPTKLYRIPYGYQLKLEVPLSGRNPTALAADTLGYIWLSDPGANKIYQLDPVSDPGQFIITATFDIPTPDAGVQALAVNPYTNDIWFVEGNTGQLGWINRATGDITDTIYAYDVNDLPTDLAIDRSGDVWFTLANSSRIGRYDKDLGVLREYKTPTDNANPAGITIDPYGHVWFAEYAAGKIARANPAQLVQNTALGITEYGISSDDSCPYGMVADIGPDVGLGGRIWFTDKCANQIASWRANSFAPQTLFSDDFSAGAGNWSVDAGTWITVAGTLEGSGGGDNHVHGPALSWPNYRVQADVMLLSDGRAGVTVRESASDQHYRAEIGINSAGHGYAYLGKVVAGSYITLAQANVDVVQGYSHTLQVDMNENVVRFSVDERLMALVEDDALANGYVGLHTTDATARFDNVRVERDVYSASGYFNAYSIPTEGSRPQDIAVRYDGGDVWFTERGTHKVGNLIRQADGSPARLQYTLVTSGTWGDDPDPLYKLPWYAYDQSIMPINAYSVTGQLAGLLDPNWESTERVAAFAMDGITYRDNGPNCPTTRMKRLTQLLACRVPTGTVPIPSMACSNPSACPSLPLTSSTRLSRDITYNPSPRVPSLDLATAPAVTATQSSPGNGAVHGVQRR